MKRYLKNLMAALCGRNPYNTELDELTDHYEKAAANVQELQEMYYNSLDMQARIKEQVDGYQTLTENLRERIGEKDELMERMKKEYQQRIEAYNKEIDRLRNSSHE